MIREVWKIKKRRSPEPSGRMARPVWMDEYSKHPKMHLRAKSRGIGLWNHLFGRIVEVARMDFLKETFRWSLKWSARTDSIHPLEWIVWVLIMLAYMFPFVWSICITFKPENCLRFLSFSHPISLSKTPWKPIFKRSLSLDFDPCPLVAWRKSENKGCRSE